MTTLDTQEVPPVMICTRFGIRIREHAWLAHRLELISSITAPSLLAQQDQRFNWVILVDEDLPADIRRGLEEMLEPFKGRAFLQLASRRSGKPSWVTIAREHSLTGGTPYLLTGRLDDDDAWSISTVRFVRERVASWLRRPDRGRGWSVVLPNGLEWVMYNCWTWKSYSAAGSESSIRQRCVAGTRR